MSASARSLVHLVGSFPGQTPQEVFALCGRELAEYLKRVPDGEAHGWINFSIESLAKARGLERIDAQGEVHVRAWATQDELKEYHERSQGQFGPKLRVTPGLPTRDIEFAPLGYDRIARDSYALFREARAAGRLPKTIRFQVGLPTPFATLAATMSADDVATALPRFEETLFREVDVIAASIPHDDLAIQWEVAVEVVTVLERLAPPFAARFTPESVADALCRACERVPASAQAGVHLCYGNPGGKHVVEPKDTRVLTEFANLFVTRVRRSIDWLHLPVPIARDDDAYFAPLAKLRLPPETELFLGLVHLQDGLEGARRRMAAARKFVQNFGVATECGLRFYRAESISEILALHREAARANANAAASG